MHKEKAYRLIKWAFAAAAVCIGFFVVITYLNMQHSLKQSGNVSVSLRKLLYYENLLTEIQAVETGQRGYMLTGDEAFLTTHNNGLRNISKDLPLLTDRNINDPAQLAGGKVLADLIGQKITNSKYGIAVRKTAGFDSAAAFLRTGKGESIMSRIRDQIHSLEDTDRQMLQDANKKSGLSAKETTWQFIWLALAFYIILYLNYRIIIRDFKRRKQAEDILKYNASLINSISDPVITTDKDLKITKWNRHAEELYGWKEAEVLGKTAREILNTRFLDTDYDTSVNNISSMGLWKGEVIHSHKDGHTLYLLSTVTALYDEGSAFTGTVAVIRNITQRKKVEEQLKLLKLNLEDEVQQKVAELNNVFERITDAFIALDNDWNYIYVNKKAADLHGLPPNDLIGKNIWEIFPDVVNEAFFAALHKARDTMQPLRLELYYSRTKQWFEDLIYPSADGISVYYHDITEKKKIELELRDAESKFRNLVEGSP